MSKIQIQDIEQAVDTLVTDPYIHTLDVFKTIDLGFENEIITPDLVSPVIESLLRCAILDENNTQKILLVHKIIYNAMHPKNNEIIAETVAHTLLFMPIKYHLAAKDILIKLFREDDIPPILLNEIDIAIGMDDNDATVIIVGTLNDVLTISAVMADNVLGRVTTIFDKGTYWATSVVLKSLIEKLKKDRSFDCRIHDYTSLWTKTKQAITEPEGLMNYFLNESGRLLAVMAFNQKKPISKLPPPLDDDALKTVWRYDQFLSDIELEIKALYREECEQKYGNKFWISDYDFAKVIDFYMGPVLRKSK